MQNNSISFIKRLSQDISVVVRITNKGAYSYRTMYPLMSAQLDKYLKDGTAWEYPKNGDKQSAKELFWCLFFLFHRFFRPFLPGTFPIFIGKVAFAI